MKTPSTILYYVHDPMCSWCWGFQPVWQDVSKQLSDKLQIKYLLGGLASDSDIPMPKAMQADIAGYWRKIQKHIPGTEFNFDFWEKCQPRRSTYPACRAVIAARKQDSNTELAMIKAIQRAYYLYAKNPSDDHILADLAESLKLERQKFLIDLNSQETQQELEQEIQYSRQIGSQGFPSLILAKEDEYSTIPIDYNNAESILRNLALQTE